MTRKRLSRANSARKAFADGVNNPLLRVGDLTRNTFNATAYAPEFRTLNRQQIEWAYQTSWLCQIAVDIVAQDMTREGIDITGHDPVLAQKLGEVLDDYRVWDSVSDAIKWARLYGGSIAVMLIDGDDMSLPLRDVPKGSFRGLAVFDRWQLDQTNGQEDLCQELGPNFGKPLFYRPSPAASEIRFAQDRIHSSRVLRFEGRRLPYFLRQSYQGWGGSVLEPVWQKIQAFDLATQSAAQLLSKAYLRYYKVPGLADIMTNSLAREGFLKQMDAMREFQSVEGLTIGDKEDDFQVFNYTFTGIPEILLQLGQQVSGAFGIPLVRLFGQSPTGMNATGESDIRTYYDSVRQKQDSDLRSGMKRLLRVIYQSVTGTPAPDDFGFEFRSLWQMTQNDKAQVAQVSAGTILQALQEGALSLPNALQELKALSDTVGIFSSITDKDIREAEEQEEQADMEPPAPEVNGINQAEPPQGAAPVPGADENGAPRQVVQETAQAGGEGRGPDRGAVSGRN